MQEQYVVKCQQTVCSVRRVGANMETTVCVPTVSENVTYIVQYLALCIQFSSLHSLTHYTKQISVHSKVL